MYSPNSLKFSSRLKLVYLWLLATSNCYALVMLTVQGYLGGDKVHKMETVKYGFAILRRRGTGCDLLFARITEPTQKGHYGESLAANVFQG